MGLDNKECIKCGEVQSLAHFPKLGGNICRRCKTQKAVAWQRANPVRHYGHIKANRAKHRASHNARQRRYRSKVRARKYGLTLEQQDALLAHNNGMCPICKDRPVTDIDHCHATGKVRGALCHTCNTGIGMLRDSPEFLRSAAEYLEK